MLGNLDHFSKDQGENEKYLKRPPRNLRLNSEKTDRQKTLSYPLFSGWKTTIIMVDLIPVQVVFINQTKQERLKRTLQCQKHTH